MERDFETAYRIISTHTENLYVWIKLKPDGSTNRSMKVSYADAHTFLREATKEGQKVPVYISGEDVFIGYMVVV
jgi:hypothetical protein